jgi:hypothetical protein
MQEQAYAAWFQKWAADMASDVGTGKVPAPGEATVSSAGGVGGGKVGNKRFPRNKKGGRVPPVSAAFARKL